MNKLKNRAILPHIKHEKPKIHAYKKTMESSQKQKLQKKRTVQPDSQVEIVY